MGENYYPFTHNSKRITPVPVIVNRYWDRNEEINEIKKRIYGWNKIKIERVHVWIQWRLSDNYSATKHGELLRDVIRILTWIKGLDLFIFILVCFSLVYHIVFHLRLFIFFGGIYLWATVEDLNGSYYWPLSGYFLLIFLVYYFLTLTGANLMTGLGSFA